MTPPSLARFAASLLDFRVAESVRLLDPCAGAGSLTAAVLERAGQMPSTPELMATCVELDPTLCAALEEVLSDSRAYAAAAGLSVSSDVIARDFVPLAASWIDAATFPFTHVILNPPYKKLKSDSRTAEALNRLELHSNNLYAAFTALCIRLLAPGGQLVAILPRSFCNGPYFKSFRRLLLAETSIERLHLFDSRTESFVADGVLQENLVLKLSRRAQAPCVWISSGRLLAATPVAPHPAPFEQVVRRDDPESFIRVTTEGHATEVAHSMHSLPARLDDLGVQVSTGKVVDFRVRPLLRAEASDCTLPLIYPAHLRAGTLRWPLASARPNALHDTTASRKLCFAPGTYVAVKRFSSKEEPRRVVAALVSAADVPDLPIAFENHLNVFHCAGQGLEPALARGLCSYLNSALVDDYFRQFNGHTQVNATDLKNLYYPDREQLIRLGAVASSAPS